MKSLFLASVGVILATPAFAQQASFNDPLVDHLAGKWVLSGEMDHGQVTHDFNAEWVLAHQYLEINEVSREKNKDNNTITYTVTFQ